VVAGLAVGAPTVALKRAVLEGVEKAEAVEESEAKEAVDTAEAVTGGDGVELAVEEEVWLTDVLPILLPEETADVLGCVEGVEAAVAGEEMEACGDEEAELVGKADELLDADGFEEGDALDERVTEGEDVEERLPRGLAVNTPLNDVLAVALALLLTLGEAVGLVVTLLERVGAGPVPDMVRDAFGEEVGEGEGAGERDTEGEVVVVRVTTKDAAEVAEETALLVMEGLPVPFALRLDDDVTVAPAESVFSALPDGKRAVRVLRGLPDAPADCVTLGERVLEVDSVALGEDFALPEALRVA